MVRTLQDGTRSEFPSFDMITGEIFQYWIKRSSESKNPILKARYLGLVMEFQETITGTKPAYTIKKEYAATLLKAVTGGYCSRPMYAFRKLERALSIALSINDQPLVEACKSVIQQKETEYSIDDKPGLWGYSYDLLLENRKIKLPAPFSIIWNDLPTSTITLFTSSIFPFFR